MIPINAVGVRVVILADLTTVAGLRMLGARGTTVDVHGAVELDDRRLMFSPFSYAPGQMKAIRFGSFEFRPLDAVEKIAELDLRFG